MSPSSPFSGLSGDGLRPSTMATLRRRSEPFTHLNSDEDLSTDQDAAPNGAQSKPVRRLTGRLLRNNTLGLGEEKDKERKDSLHLFEIPQINIRTSTEKSLPQRLLGTSTPGSRPDTPPDSLPRQSSDLSARLPIDAARRKGVAFLSRLGMRGGRKKDDQDDHDDGASALSEYRSDADGKTVMSSSDAAGFIPHRKEPPKYLRMRPYNTKEVEFEHLFLAQELSRAKPMASTAPITTAGKRVVHSADSIWAAEFSKDGRYLAVAGQDQIVRVYALLSTSEERRTYEDEAQEISEGQRVVSAPVFRAKPIREYSGHTGSIHDLAWSKNNFLLSSSADKTVRLWYPSLPNCLHVFDHKDSVMSIAFCPTDDRFFLAGAQDSVLRLWNIPDKEVAFQVQETDIITAVAFAPDGKTCIAGLMNGDCIFYDTKGLKRQTQIQVRSSRGKNSKGSKITSIQAMSIPPEKPDAEVKVLISSNDSRIRIYNLSDKSLDSKLKGHENSCSNVKARFSDDGAFVITGSEDRRAFIWSTDTSKAESKDKRPFESFVAHSGAVTAAIIAPKAARMLLSASGDPVYDLCNPPPVTLMSMAEVMATNSLFPDDPPDTPTRIKKMEESPAYVARSAHPDGNIIVTTDRTGQIRIFRQDCASAKRRSDMWEMGSSARLGISSRTASILTKNSGGSRVHSRRGSLVGANGPNGILTPQQSTERINSWRHNVEGGQGARSRPVSLPASIITSPIPSERSRSPSKAATNRTSAAASLVTLASEARRAPYTALSSPAYGRFPPGSPTSSIHTNRTAANTNASGSPTTHHEKEKDLAPSHPPTPSFTFRSIDSVEESELNMQAGLEHNAGASASGTSGPFSFWNSFSKLRGISALRISTAPSSPKLESDSPSSPASPSLSNGGHSPAIGTGRVSVGSPLIRVSCSDDEDR